MKQSDQPCLFFFHRPLAFDWKWHPIVVALLWTKLAVLVARDGAMLDLKFEVGLGQKGGVSAFLGALLSRQRLHQRSRNRNCWKGNSTRIPNVQTFRRSQWRYFSDFWPIIWPWNWFCGSRHLSIILWKSIRSSKFTPFFVSNSASLLCQLMLNKSNLDRFARPTAVLCNKYLK